MHSCNSIYEMMKKLKRMMMMIVVLVSTWAASAGGAVDCSTVTGLVMACTTFISVGSPDPFPGTPCCDAMTSLDLVADSVDNRRAVCRCMQGLISTYNPNATAIATIPGFCGVSFGFTIDPNTDCSFIA